MNKRGKQKIPAVIIVFLIFVGLAILSFLNGFPTIFRYDQFPKALFLGKIEFLIYSLFSLAMLLFIFIGTLKRKMYARVISLIYYPFLFIFSLLNFIYYKMNPGILMSIHPIISEIPELSEIFSKLISITLWGSLIFSFLLTIFVIIIMKKKKDYFSD